jgi:undecaprenyl-diphosphatase
MKDQLVAKICAVTIVLQLFLFGNNGAQAQNIDINWLRSVNYNSDKTEMSYKAMNGLSKSVYFVAAGVPLAQLAVGYSTGDKETIRNGWVSLAGQGLTQVITFAGKNTIRRERPYLKYPDIHTNVYDDTYSFPSGHTSMAFSTATMLSLQYPKWYVIVPSFAYAGAVGYSRMYLGRHYPSDVFAGAVVGAGTSYLCFKLNKWLQGRRAARQRPLVNPFSPLDQPF